MDSMKVLQEFDAYNYLRYASWYAERIKVIEKTHNSLFLRLDMGHFVVRDRANSFFSAVAGDMKLEQSINRFSNNPGAPVTIGSSGDDAALSEFHMLFHEVIAISNLLQSLTSPRLMDHMETNIRHDLSGKSGYVFDESVKHLLDFVNSRQNPFKKPEVKVPLHNSVTNQIVNDSVKVRILNALRKGDEAYASFRKECYIEKTK